MSLDGSNVVSVGGDHGTRNFNQSTIVASRGPQVAYHHRMMKDQSLSEKLKKEAASPP